MQPGRKPRDESRFKIQARLLSDRVRAGRDAKSLTQESLAAAAGVSLSWLSKLESGKLAEPGYFPVLAVLRALDLDSDRRS